MPKTAERPTVTHTAMGYRATRSGDQLIVHDVQIFCACERDEFIADETWVARAVQNALAKQRDGYFPPLHTRHHERETAANDSVRAAGFFRITRAAPMTLQGRRRLAIFADLVITDPMTQDDVLHSRYLYRSVEIFDAEGEPSIDSLALLDHEAPFLEMPLLLIKSVTTDESVSPETISLNWDRQRGPVVACFRRGKSAHLLFHEDAPMADENKETTTEETTDAVQPELFQGDEEKDDDKESMEDGEGAALDVGAVVKAIKSGRIMQKDFDAILQAIQEQGATGDDEMAPDELAPAAAPGAETMKKDKVSMDAVVALKTEIVALKGEVQTLRTNIDNRDAGEVRAGEVAAAMKRLDGRPLGADLESDLTSFHKQYGAPAFKDHVARIAKTVGVLNVDDADDENLNVTGAPEIAMKFAKHGVTAIDKATQLVREWEQLHSYGMKTPKDSFVVRGMKRAGFQLEQSA